MTNKAYFPQTFFHHEPNKRNSTASRETLFLLAVLKGSWGGRQTPRCLQSHCWTPPSFFFFFSFHHQTLLSWSPLKSPADTPSSCPRARQADGSKKKQQLCSWSTATKKATKTRGKKKQTSHTAQYTTTWICTFNSWLWQHIMPKPDFTSRPERMSSCFPHTHTDCDGGGKLWAGWQQTPP